MNKLEIATDKILKWEIEFLRGFWIILKCLLHNLSLQDVSDALDEIDRIKIGLIE